MGTNFRGCLIFAFFAVWFEIREMLLAPHPYNTILNDYCRENLYPRKFRIKEDSSNPRNIEPSKFFTHTVYIAIHMHSKLKVGVLTLPSMNIAMYSLNRRKE